MTKTMIGQTIASEEEYIGEDNTFIDDDGNIKSKIIGNTIKDDEEKTIKVRGKIEKLIPTDRVFGEVIDVRPKIVLIGIKKIMDKNEMIQKYIPGGMAALPVRSVSREFIDQLRDITKIGDLIKAEISSIDNGMIDLSTKFKGLGVISAFCSRCRTKLKIKEADRRNRDLTIMECPRCKNKETRKIGYKYM